MSSSQLATNALRRAKVLSLYRTLLRTSHQWPIFQVMQNASKITSSSSSNSNNKKSSSDLSYDSLRECLIDTIKEEFHASKNDTDVEIIHEKIKRAEREIKNMNILLDGRISRAFPLLRDYKSIQVPKE